MKNTLSTLWLTLLIFPGVHAFAQNSAPSLPDAPTYQARTDRVVPLGPRDARTTSAARDKLRYYLDETYFNPSAVTAPAFRAGLRMANPPGKGATRYPLDWRQGAEAFGRNYGDAVAERVSFQTARFAAGIVTREDPRYSPSSSHNVLARSFHAIGFAFVDRTDSGCRTPAIANFVGAAAAGFTGNAYLPAGFNDLTHAGQRATVRLGIFAAGNLFREFAPQMPAPMRRFIILIAR